MKILFYASAVCLLSLTLAEPPVGDSYASALSAHHHEHNGFGRASPSQSYGAPNQRSFGLSQEYEAPSSRNSLSQEYGAPSARGGLSQEYGAPSARGGLSQEYGAPSSRSGLSQEYGAPSSRNSLSDTYGAPNQRSGLSQEYGAPSSRSFGLSQEYGAPNSRSSGLSQEYGVPGGNSGFRSSPSQQYGAPGRSGPSQSYGAPGSRSGKHGASSFRNSGHSHSKSFGSHGSSHSRNALSQNHGAPRSGLSQEYGAPDSLDSYAQGFQSRSQFPSQSYGAPRSADSLKTNAFAQSFASARNPSSKYGAPSARSGLSQSYGAPGVESRSGMPSEEYGVPDQYNALNDQGHGYGESARTAAALQELLNQEPANYDFSYKVNDYESGSDFGHTETRQENRAEGSYFVVLPDGTKQVVEYEADERGFKPRISVEPVGGYDDNASDQSSSRASGGY